MKSFEELKIDLILKSIGKPFFREYRFHIKRKWKFDFAFPELKVAIEFEGGIFAAGRHVRGKGFANDVEKYREATLSGWRVLRYTSEDFKKFGHSVIIDDIKRVMENE